MRIQATERGRKEAFHKDGRKF